MTLFFIKICLEELSFVRKMCVYVRACVRREAEMHISSVGYPLSSVTPTPRCPPQGRHDHGVFMQILPSVQTITIVMQSEFLL